MAIEEVLSQAIFKRNQQILEKALEIKLKKDLLEKVDKAVPAYVRSYIKEKVKPSLTAQEISSLVVSTIEKNKQPEKVIEKTVERIIEKPQKQENKYAELSQIEDLKKQIEELKNAFNKKESVINVVGEMLPNHNGIAGNLYSDGNRLSWAAASSNSASSGTFVIGDGSDGSWRLTVTGTDLSVQRLESGVWVEKGAFLAT